MNNVLFFKLEIVCTYILRLTLLINCKGFFFICLFAFVYLFYPWSKQSSIEKKQFWFDLSVQERLSTRKYLLQLFYCVYLIYNVFLKQHFNDNFCFYFLSHVGTFSKIYPVNKSDWYLNIFYFIDLFSFHHII